MASISTSQPEVRIQRWSASGFPTSLKGFHRVMNCGDSQLNVAPDGSPIFTRDTGYQEIYALNIRWP